MTTVSVELNKTLGDFKVEKIFSSDNNLPPYTLAVFHNQTKQLMYGADANLDPITGSLSLDNGMYKGLHRQYWDLCDERPSGTPGGDFPCNTWVPRQFSVIDGVCGMGVHLMKDDKTIRLEPGMYHIKARAPAFGVGYHQVRLYNITKHITEKHGTNACSASDENITESFIPGYRLNVSGGSQEFQLQHKCDGGRPYDGLGKATGFVDGMEVYATLNIHRLN